MPEGQAEPCYSYKWVDVLRASLEHQVKSCCTWLKTGQATASHPLSHTEFKISPPATDRISVLFSTQESFFLPPLFFFHLANNFFLSLRIPHETITFIMLQYLSPGKSLLTLPRTWVLFSASFLSLVMCLSYPVNDTLLQLPWSEQMLPEQVISPFSVTIHKSWNMRLGVMWKSWEEDSDVHLVSEPGKELLFD